MIVRPMMGWYLCICVHQISLDGFLSRWGAEGRKLPVISLQLALAH